MAASEMPERTRMIITVVIVLAVNLILGCLLYYARGEFKKLETQHIAKMKEKAALDAFLKQQADKEKELADLTERYRIQESKLPEQEMEPELLAEIDKVAIRNGCKQLTVTKVSGAAAGRGGLGTESYTRSTWKTKWEANFEGWATLMNEMEEDFPRFVSFESLTIQPKNNGVVLPKTPHEISVDVVTYQYIREKMP
jgi:Tfp pilus assembly protein PilO